MRLAQTTSMYPMKTRVNHMTHLYCVALQSSSACACVTLWSVGNSKSLTLIGSDRQCLRCRACCVVPRTSRECAIISASTVIQIQSRASFSIMLIIPADNALPNSRTANRRCGHDLLIFAQQNCWVWVACNRRIVLSIYYKGGAGSLFATAGQSIRQEENISSRWSIPNLVASGHLCLARL